MADVSNELIYEVLEGMQDPLTNIDAGFVEMRTELRAMRGHLVAMQTDIANLYVGYSNFENRLARIERRLELTDVTAT
jgi:hypothetical protein